ncbi:unnamed protein product [Prorocentrum cordatum]|uniref:Uncharacterized protein n=1 Tax=Prorocentrum cordatum TaxID=2364126 RepID=A0ABN9QK68_9DINO|nr:unnamed protein product [Polarella glacialis]
MSLLSSSRLSGTVVAKRPHPGRLHACLLRSHASGGPARRAVAPTAALGRQLVIFLVGALCATTVSRPSLIVCSRSLSQCFSPPSFLHSSSSSKTTTANRQRPLPFLEMPTRPNVGPKSGQF